MYRMDGVVRIEKRKESMKGKWVGEWPSFMWIHVIVHKAVNKVI